MQVPKTSAKLVPRQTCHSRPRQTCVNVTTAAQCSQEEEEEEGGDTEEEGEECRMEPVTKCQMVPSFCWKSPLDLR